MARLSGRQVVTLQELVKAGVSNVEAARPLGVTEGAVRYHLRRQAAGATDGRAQRAMLAESFRPAIDAYLEAVGEKAPSNVTELHDWLVAEHDYPGSVRNLQRYVRRAFPAPPVRARRRVETPPGAQAQADWAHFPGVLVGGRQRDLVAFSMILSHSGADTIANERVDGPAGVALVPQRGVPQAGRHPGHGAHRHQTLASFDFAFQPNVERSRIDTLATCA